MPLVFRSQFLVMVYQGGLQLVTFASLGLFLFVGALEVVHGSLSLGRFVATVGSWPIPSKRKPPAGRGSPGGRLNCHTSGHSVIVPR